MIINSVLSNASQSQPTPRKPVCLAAVAIMTGSYPRAAMVLAFLSALCCVTSTALAPTQSGISTLWKSEPHSEFFSESTKYVQYIPGNLPLILTVPHGGYRRPEELPKRTAGVLGGDANTLELARALFRQLKKQFNGQPHVVLCHLDRIVVDMNRDISEGTQDNPATATYYKAYHAFVEKAKKTVLDKFGHGFLTDLHGHAHSPVWIELGYGLKFDDFLLDDATLDSDRKYARRSSIRFVSKISGDVTFSELLRGDRSFGGILAQNGYPAVPSPLHTQPADRDEYFAGGFTTRYHSSMRNGKIDGVQIETPRAVRMESHAKEAFAIALARSIGQYMKLNLDLDLSAVPH